MILVDSGPLVALLNRADRHHAACLDVLRQVREPLLTTWPVLTEAMGMLRAQDRGRAALAEMVARGVPGILELPPEDAPKLAKLMAKHRRRGMNLAQASLVRAAEREAGCRTVFTLARSDFETYRIGGRGVFQVLPGKRRP